MLFCAGPIARGGLRFRNVWGCLKRHTCSQNTAKPLPRVGFLSEAFRDVFTQKEAPLWRESSKIPRPPSMDLLRGLGQVSRDWYSGRRRPTLEPNYSVGCDWFQGFRSWLAGTRAACQVLKILSKGLVRTFSRVSGFCLHRRWCHKWCPEKGWCKAFLAFKRFLFAPRFWCYKWCRQVGWCQKLWCYKWCPGKGWCKLFSPSSIFLVCTTLRCHKWCRQLGGVRSCSVTSGVWESLVQNFSCGFAQNFNADLVLESRHCPHLQVHVGLICGRYWIGALKLVIV